MGDQWTDIPPPAPVSSSVTADQVIQADHADGYARVKQVTQTARELQLTSNALLTCAKPKDRDGICHQLANEDRLLWTKS